MAHRWSYSDRVRFHRTPATQHRRLYSREGTQRTEPCLVAPEMTLRLQRQPATSAPALVLAALQGRCTPARSRRVPFCTHPGSTLWETYHVFSQLDRAVRPPALYPLYPSSRVLSYISPYVGNPSMRVQRVQGYTGGSPAALCAQILLPRLPSQSVRAAHGIGTWPVRSRPGVYLLCVRQV